MHPILRQEIVFQAVDHSLIYTLLKMALLKQVIPNTIRTLHKEYLANQNYHLVLAQKLKESSADCRSLNKMSPCLTQPK